MIETFTGTVKWFDEERGFGFISEVAGRVSDVFVHYSGIAGHGRRSLYEGQTVEFELAPGKKGDQAVDVRVVE